MRVVNAIRGNAHRVLGSASFILEQTSKIVYDPNTSERRDVHLAYRVISVWEERRCTRAFFHVASLRCEKT